MITFLSRNQFKKKLSKYIVKPKTEPKLGQSTSSQTSKMISSIMNPSLQVTKELVKVAAYIDSDPINYFK